MPYTDKERERRLNSQYYLRETYRGKTLLLDEWAEMLGIAYQTLYMRYKRGERGAQLLRPLNSRAELHTNEAKKNPDKTSIIHVLHDGLHLPLTEWARVVGVRYSALYERYKKGVRGEDLFRPTNTDCRTNKPNNILINGVPLKTLAEQNGLPYNVVYARYKRAFGRGKPITTQVLFRPIWKGGVRPTKDTSEILEVPEIAQTTATHEGKTQALYEWAAELGVDISFLLYRYGKGARDSELFKPCCRTGKLKVKK